MFLPQHLFSRQGVCIKRFRKCNCALKFKISFCVGVWKQSVFGAARGWRKTLYCCLAHRRDLAFTSALSLGIMQPAASCSPRNTQKRNAAEITHFQPHEIFKSQQQLVHSKSAQKANTANHTNWKFYLYYAFENECWNFQCVFCSASSWFEFRATIYMFYTSIIKLKFVLKVPFLHLADVTKPPINSIEIFFKWIYL